MRTPGLLGRRLALSLVPLLMAPAVLLRHGEAVAAPGTSVVAVRYVRANFDRPPTWTLSGAWASADRLMLADPVGNTVLEYQMPSGRMVGTLPKSLAADFGLAKPSQIRATPKGDLMLKWTNDRLVTFSNTFRVKERPVEVVAALDEKAAASSHPRIESLWGWTLAGNDVLGYGDISSDGRQHWESGVFRFPASNPRAFDIQSHSGQDSSRIFYRLDMPFLTGQEDGTGYVLLMKDLLGIYRSEKGKTDLDFVTALPKGLEVSPGLPDFRRKEDLPSVMRAIEQSTMPAGLWAWERHLYLLSRAPAGTKTRWTLFKVEFDPHTGAAQFIGVELPTHAHHLTVVPGSRWWALVEKGPVLAFGAQAIDSVVLIPSEALRGSLHVKFVTE